LEGNDYVFCQAEWEAWQAAIAWRDKQVADALCTPEAPIMSILINLSRQHPAHMAAHKKRIG